MYVFSYIKISNSLCLRKEKNIIYVYIYSRPQQVKVLGKSPPYHLFKNMETFPHSSHSLTNKSHRQWAIRRTSSVQKEYSTSDHQTQTQPSLLTSFNGRKCKYVWQRLSRVSQCWYQIHWCHFAFPFSNASSVAACIRQYCWSCLPGKCLVLQWYFYTVIYLALVSLNMWVMWVTKWLSCFNIMLEFSFLESRKGHWYLQHYYYLMPKLPTTYKHMSFIKSCCQCVDRRLLETDMQVHTKCSCLKDVGNVIQCVCNQRIKI